MVFRGIVSFEVTNCDLKSYRSPLQFDNSPLLSRCLLDVREDYLDEAATQDLRQFALKNYLYARVFDRERHLDTLHFDSVVPPTRAYF